MLDIITIGSATLDVFLRSPGFKIGKRGRERLVLEGGKVEVEEVFFQSGGGATNTAVGFSRLGLKTAAVARFGDDLPGQWLAKELMAEKFDQRFLLQIKGDKTDYSTILVGDNGERIILVSRGQSRLEEKIFPFLKLPASQWVYLSSLEGNFSLLEKITFWAKERGSRIALNPGGREIRERKKIKALLPLLTVLIVNEEEASAFWGKDWQQAIKRCPAKITVVTRGAKGACLASGGKLIKEPIFKRKTVDATGAGDAFSVGLLAGFCWEKNLKESLRLAMITSGLVVSALGAKTGLPNKGQLLKLSSR
ncbi:carbohydrate kinase family protein [Candidatus Shapirobacteria bacterium]|nr:carbohydrate kinase family protein [Candidatus Shapirobacteria bacterium]